MIKVSVTYPSGEGRTFDHDYYANSHVPLCLATWKPVKSEIEKGLDGPNVAGMNFYFETMGDFHAAFAAAATGDVLADVANCTNITPVVQVSEIVG